MQKYVKTFNSLFENTTTNSDLDVLAQKAVDYLGDISNMVELGMLDQSQLAKAKKEVVTNHRNAIKSQFDEDVDLKAIDPKTWTASPFGKVLSSDLYAALQSQEFAKLKEQGWKIKPMSVQQLINGTIVLTHPNTSEAWMTIRKTSKALVRTTKTGSTPLYTSEWDGIQLYTDIFQHILDTFDTTDKNLATNRGAEIKRKRAIKYDKVMQMLIAAYHTILSPKLTEQILNRLSEASPHDLFTKNYSVNYGPAQLERFAKVAKEQAANGILFLGIRQYDVFFNRELENLFLENNIKWMPHNYLYVGQIVQFGMERNSRGDGLFYGPLQLMVIPDVQIDPRYGHKQFKLDINSDQVGRKLTELVLDKADAAAEAGDYESKVTLYPQS